jgi:hypothetical protein
MVTPYYGLSNTAARLAECDGHSSRESTLITYAKEFLGKKKTYPNGSTFTIGERLLCTGVAVLSLLVLAVIGAWAVKTVVSGVFSFQKAFFGLC